MPLATSAIKIPEPRPFTNPAIGEYVALTRVAGWHDGERSTTPVYVNRRHVTHVVGGRSTTVHFAGEVCVEVTESVECVVEALEG